MKRTPISTQISLPSISQTPRVAPSLISSNSRIAPRGVNSSNSTLISRNLLKRGQTTVTSKVPKLNLLPAIKYKMRNLEDPSTISGRKVIHVLEKESNLFASNESYIIEENIDAHEYPSKVIYRTESESLTDSSVSKLTGFVERGEVDLASVAIQSFFYFLDFVWFPATASFSRDIINASVASSQAENIFESVLFLLLIAVLLDMAVLPGSRLFYMQTLFAMKKKFLIGVIIVFLTRIIFSLGLNAFIAIKLRCCNKILRNRRWDREYLVFLMLAVSPFTIGQKSHYIVGISDNYLYALIFLALQFLFDIGLMIGVSLEIEGSNEYYGNMGFLEMYSNRSIIDKYRAIVSYLWGITWIFLTLLISKYSIQQGGIKLEKILPLQTSIESNNGSIMSGIQKSPRNMVTNESNKESSFEDLKSIM